MMTLEALRALEVWYDAALGAGLTVLAATRPLGALAFLVLRS